jgi:hypothetical protein
MKGLLVDPVLLLLLVAIPASVDCQKGLDAYENGDYAIVLEERTSNSEAAVIPLSSVRLLG